jgi:hypothetical protein
VVTRTGSRPLSRTQQAFALRACFPEASITISNNGLVWRGHVQPTVASRVYYVEVIYVGAEYPRVFVLDPPLEKNGEGVLPHFFHEGAICLHERHEWQPGMRIVDTIMPWTAEWLAHYEIWLATGHWFGDGDDGGHELHGIGDTEPPLSRAVRRRYARRLRSARDVSAHRGP